jgi:hypothetical protein
MYMSLIHLDVLGAVIVLKSGVACVNIFFGNDNYYKAVSSVFNP